MTPARHHLRSLAVGIAAAALVGRSGTPDAPPRPSPTTAPDAVTRRAVPASWSTAPAYGDRDR